MVVDARPCPGCGAENPARAKFCLECGASLQFQDEPPEVRKVVTLVFCDLTGSTALGEKMDPESLRRVMSSYFDEMRAALERHGGTIEKFIGDAVMAVFGIPVLHEDDALRGVRAAAEMQTAMRRLNEDLVRDHGTGLQARIGVNTGEVVAGDASQGQAFATGDTVNVAARFEQAAPPGEILMGEETYRLVRDWVEAEAVAPLDLKGKSEPIPAFKLVRFVAPAARHLDTPFVGRDRELDELVDTFHEAVTDKTCRLVTVLGTAGVGKSRIVEELNGRLGDEAQIIAGNCLPYGDGITFWPLAECVKQAAGVAEDDSAEQAREKIGALLAGSEDAAIVESRLEEALGLKDQVSESQEMFWAVRRFFETLSTRTPLVAVFDDIHWAEPTFLDLIEYIVGWSKEHPILLLCLARNELVEVRPAWGSGQQNASTVLLEPLSDEATAELVSALLGGMEVPPAARRRIVDASEGNPLFVGEMLRMMIDDGLLTKSTSGWTVTGNVEDVPVPGSIQALVAARLDRLDQEERQVVGRGSVIGRLFWWGAITQITPENLRASVAGHLQTLVRRELIVPERSTFPGEDAFRFSSVLITDAAYSGLSKKLRADLHEAFLEWLERKAGERVKELEEIFGYHLERAYSYRRELGLNDDRTAELGRRAGRLLGSAGRRALARADMPAAANLLRRAVALVDRSETLRAELQLELVAAVTETEGISEAEEVLAEAMTLCDELGDERLRARAAVQKSYLAVYAEVEEGWKESALADVRDAIAVFEKVEDHLGLAQAQQLMAEIRWNENRYGEVEKILDEALEHSQKAGAARESAKILGWLPYVAFWGPTESGRALQLCDAVLKLADGNQMVEAKTFLSMAGLEAMRGRFPEARELVARSKSMFEELGLSFTRAAATQVSGMIEMLAGDPAAAEVEFREGYDSLGAMGDRGYLPSFAAYLAEAVYAQGRLEEADGLASESEGLCAPDDVTAKLDWGPVRAKLLARGGAVDDAEALVREVVEIAGRTDELMDQADALMDLAEVLRLAQRPSDAAAIIRQALELYERKGVVCAVARARSLLDELAA